MTLSSSGAASQLGAFTASSTDLAQDGSTALLSSTVTASGGFGDSGADDLGNGMVTNANGTRGLFLRPGQHFPSTLDLTFDTSVNTLGYDISSITTIAAWGNNGASLANQLYELSYSQVGSASFTTPVLTDFTPFDGTPEDTSGATQVTHTGVGGSLFATGVDAIRITFQDPEVNNGGVTGSAYQEVDVQGIATTAVPEPSSAALLLAGGIGMLVSRRRK